MRLRPGALVATILLLASPLRASHAAVPGEYLNLSFTGDGVTPSSLEMFAAQERSLAPTRGAGSVSEQGDFTWSVPVELPPALLSPELGLDYSSAAGSHSTVARGWSLRAGMVITRITGLERDRAYASVHDVYRVSGGGLSGVVFDSGGAWVYASNGVVAASFEQVGDEWIVRHKGITTWLSPSDAGPHVWHTRQVRDNAGNRVNYEWGIEPAARRSQLLAVEFGGAGGETGSTTSPHLVRVELAYEPHPHAADRYSEGVLDRITDRLAAIEVWTRPLGTGGFDSFGGGLELSYEEIDDAELLTEVRELGTTGSSRRAATFDYASYADQLAQLAHEGDAPPVISLTETQTKPSDEASASNQLDRLQDISGDGLPETLTDTSLATWGLDTLGWYEDNAWDYSALGLGGFDTTYSVRCGNLHTQSFTVRRTVDLNSDGFPDLVETDFEIPEPWTEGGDTCSEKYVHRTSNDPTTHWTLRFGDADGFDTGTTRLAPVRYPGVGQGDISKKRYAADVAADPFTIVEGTVSDLLDVDGDGQLDIVRVEPVSTETFTIKVHYALNLAPGSYDLWDDPVDVLGSGHPLRSVLRSLQRSEHHLYVEDDTVNIDITGVPPWTQSHVAVDHIRTLTGLTDLNGDGLPDFVETESVSCNGWRVHLGTGSRQPGSAFAAPTCWTVPDEGVGLAYSNEGRPRGVACSVGDEAAAGTLTQDPFAAWLCTKAILDLEGQTGGGPGFCGIPDLPQLSCSTVGQPVAQTPITGRYQRQPLGLVDMDGDGRQDLVAAGPVDLDGDGAPDPSTATVGWWRNLGDRFAGTPHDLPEGFPDGLHGSLTTSITTMEDHTSEPVQDDEAPTFPGVANHWGLWSVSDVDRDGLPDTVVWGDPDLECVDTGATGCAEPGVTYHPRADARPGLLVAVESTFGARTEVTYVSSATTPPAGTTDPHQMAQHRDIVEQVVVEDPVTGAWGLSAYAFEDGACIPGKCLGFGKSTVTRESLTPAGCAIQSTAVTDSRTTTTFELGRDFAVPTTKVVDIHRDGLGLVRDVEWGTDYYDVTVGVSDEVTIRRPQYRERTDHGWGAGADSRTSLLTLEYDTYGNVVLSTHTAQACPEPASAWPLAAAACVASDGPAVRTSYAWSYAADGSNYVMTSATTLQPDPATSTWKAIETGTFYYDGQTQSGPFTAGLLSKQVVGAGMPGASLGASTLTWTFQRTPRGAVSATYAPAGYFETTAYTFGDALPRLRENSEGHLWQYEYDHEGRILYEVDPNGVVKGTTYDPFGRVAQTTLQPVFDDEYVTSTTTYVDAPGEAYVQVDELLYSDPGLPPTLKRGYQVLDGFGDVVQTWKASEASGRWYVSEIRRNVAGAEVATTWPHARTTFVPGLDPSTTTVKVGSCHVPDAYGRPVESWEDRTAGIAHRTFEYGAGWTREILAGDEYEKVTYEDPLGRLVEVHDGRNGDLVRTGSYAYDGRGRVTAFADAEDSAYLYDYDGAGRLRDVWRQAAFLPKDLWYHYDYDGPNPTIMEEWGTDGHAAVVWDYDTLGRPLTMAVYNEDASLDWDNYVLPWQLYTWEWDTDWIGARSRVTDPDGEALYSYDGGTFGTLGQPSRVERTWNNRTLYPEDDRSMVFEYDYTLDGRVLSTVWPSGSLVEAGYTATGWLSDHVVTTPLWAPVSVTYQYDSLGMDAGFEADSGYAVLALAVERTHPARIDGLRWSVDGVDTRGLAYEHGSTGLLDEKRVSGFVDPWVYHYDDLQRVELVTVKMDEREEYTYDTLGNKDSVRIWADPLSSQPTVAWAYVNDPFGQVLFRSGGLGLEDDFAWDGAGRMVGWDSYDQSGATALRSFAYDGKGRMVAAWDGPVQSRYGYDVDDQLVYEEAGNSSGAIYRYGGVNHYGPYPMQGTHELEQLLPMLKTWDGYLYFTFNEPDGHTLEIYDQSGGSVELDIQGIYANAMAGESNASWPVGGLHGSEPDPVWDFTRMGVRTFLDLDGTWMQPEPLLYLGPTNGNIREPLYYGPLYANGNTPNGHDRSGRVVESLFDLFSVAVDVGNIWGGAVGIALGGGSEPFVAGVTGLALDLPALLTPGAPAPGAAAGMGFDVLGMVSKGDTGVDALRTADVVDTSTIAANAAQGAAFEAKVGEDLVQTQTGVVQQVTVKTQSGVKTRLDFVGTDPATGAPKLTEAKSSATAPLTPNQTAAFPEIAETGATVVGKGKPGFPGGTQIPPTDVDIVRP